MKKKIKLFLTKKVNKLGLANEEVTVSVGFARHYLIRKGLASFDKKFTEEPKDYNELIQKINSIKYLSFIRKSTSGGILFASVSKADIIKQIETITDTTTSLEKIITINIKSKVLKNSGVFNIVISSFLFKQFNLPILIFSSESEIKENINTISL